MPFSPDGQEILFTGCGMIYSCVLKMNAGGNGQVDLSHKSEWDEGFTASSPDGTLIGFLTNRDGNWEIYVMDLDGSHPINLTNNPADDQQPYWRPWLANKSTPVTFQTVVKISNGGKQ